MAVTVAKAPFVDASPAEIRNTILPEDVPSFDEQCRRALQLAAQTYRLDELEK